ncbi:hypothetical protein AMAG_00433 [Allomyces macrogynus ATCC 38327]|uniref:AAA+ ATPase domain-containing protein n=1 Tax=Allomyces macrogynus (strain ATCC 38327) TaxID=578462 RepID=A0A0L0RWI3_ALLM3|nr:hypothetical protein AMAG_00433 [Allomyces macrogynus ATCC 38327]|eukprot:KNE54459.1 hypothetical protein AMAG_00433 [Allomyces macrogynus ATCC 38327]
MAANFFNLKARNAAASAAKDTSSNNAASAALQPWVEKYRPKSINDITSQAQVVQVLRRAIETQNLPHLLFYGPPGTGKTSTILALAKELYGPDVYRARVLELNASDERGIAVVREKVKNFARTLVAPTAADNQYPTPPYKIIVLDEADSMTADAQAALRRVMENYSKVTRFCLICNYVTRIIEPLASRCAKFRFTALEAPEIKQRLQHIADAEGVGLEDDALDAIISVSEGDLRKATMYLQSASRLVARPGAGATLPTIPTRVSAAMIRDIAGVVPPDVLATVWDLWRAAPTPTYQQVMAVVADVVAQGFAARQVITQLYAVVVADAGGQLVWPSAIAKAKIVQAFARVDVALTQGADEELQLARLVLEGVQIMARGTAPVSVMA